MRGTGKGMQNRKYRSAGLARLNRKLSFHFATVGCKISQSGDWSDCENGKHPIKGASHSNLGNSVTEHTIWSLTQRQFPINGNGLRRNPPGSRVIFI